MKKTAELSEIGVKGGKRRRLNLTFLVTILSGSVSVISSWWSLRLQKVSEFIK